MNYRLVVGNLDSINRSRYSERMKEFFYTGSIHAHMILFNASLQLPKEDYPKRFQMFIKMYKRIKSK